MNRGQTCRAIVSAVMLGSLAFGGTVNAAEPVGPKLTVKLRGLLIKEMLEVEMAMQETYSAVIQGRHDDVAEKGQAIHDSFILEQSMTEQDEKDLAEALPEGFLEIDENFHHLAEALAEAGKQRDTQAQVATFNRMTEACVACHSRYTTDRFEGLEDQAVPDAWGHEQ